MKKIGKIILVSLVLTSVFSGVALAAAGDFPEQTLPAGPQTKVALLGVINTAANWIFTIFVIVAVLFIILAAFQFVTSGGDAAKVGEARQKLIWAIVGIAIAVIARGVPVVIQQIVGS